MWFADLAAPTPTRLRGAVPIGTAPTCRAVVGIDDLSLVWRGWWDGSSGAGGRRLLLCLVGVAQLVELLVVVQAVAGSSPVAHPSLTVTLCRRGSRGTRPRRDPAAWTAAASCRYSAAMAPQSAPARSWPMTTATMPCIRRISIDSGGQRELVDLRLATPRAARRRAARDRRAPRAVGREAALARDGVPADRHAHQLQRPVGVDRVGAGRRGGSRRRRSAAFRAAASPSRTAPLIARSASMRPAGDVAHQAEVQEADAAVRAQQVVAGMRVAECDPLAVEHAEEEAEDDLPVAVAPRLVGAAHGLEALALDVLADEHAPGREVGVHVGHPHERMARAAAARCGGGSAPRARSRAPR